MKVLYHRVLLCAFVLSAALVLPAQAKTTGRVFWYANSSGSVTYATCSTLCLKGVKGAPHGGHLARILTSSDNSAVYAIASTNATCMWIGGQKPSLNVASTLWNWIQTKTFADGTTTTVETQFWDGSACVSGEYCNWDTAAPSAAGVNSVAAMNGPASSGTVGKWTDYLLTTVCSGCACEAYATSTVSPSQLASMSPSRSISTTMTFSESSRARSPSVSTTLRFSVTPTRTRTPLPTRSLSWVPTDTPSFRLTETKLTATFTPAKSKSNSQSSSREETLSSSPTPSPSVTYSSSMTNTTTPSLSSSNTRESSSSRTSSYSMSRSTSVSRESSSSRTSSDSLSRSSSPSSSSTLSLEQTESRSTSDSASPSTSLTPSDSLTGEKSASDTQTATASVSVSETWTLSPVWPESLSATVAGISPFYTVGGVPVFNSTALQAMTIFPRLADGSDLVPGWYRHPQPPFRISIETTASVVSTEFECTLHLPCTAMIKPSYEWWRPLVLSVQYDNTYGPYQILISPVYKQGPNVVLRFALSALVVADMSPMPEVYIFAVDSDGNITYTDPHFLMNIAFNESQTVSPAFPFGGALSAPVASARVTERGDPTVYRLTASYSGLQTATADFTVIKCESQKDPTVSIASNVLTQPTVMSAFFTVPFSMLFEYQHAWCLFTPFPVINGSTMTYAMQKQTFAAQHSSPCNLSCAVPSSLSTLATLMIDDVSTVARPLPMDYAPTLRIIDNLATNVTNPFRIWNESMGCVSAVWVDEGSPGRPAVRRDTILAELVSKSVRVAVFDGTSNSSYATVTNYDLVQRFDGWSICNLRLPGSSTAFTYSAYIQITMTGRGFQKDGSSYIQTVTTEVVHSPDVTCRNRNSSIPAPFQIDLQLRNVSQSREVSPVPWHPFQIFVDNSTCWYYQLQDAKLLTVNLARCEPPLADTNHLIFTSELYLLRTDYYLDFVPQFPRSSWSLPTVLALEGCANDTFPSAVGCPVRGTSPLTIIGHSFNSSLGVYFSFTDNPSRVVCGSVVFISDTKLICMNYPGFGTNGSVVMYNKNDTTAMAPISTSASRLLTFSVNAAPKCPFGANGFLCSSQGLCNPITGLCECYSSNLTGYWGGPDCGQCDERYNASDYCLMLCPTSSNGAVCSNLATAIKASASVVWVTGPLRHAS